MTCSIRRFLFAGVVLASIWGASASTASAQDTISKPVPADSIAIADVEKAAAQLVDAVEAAVRKATEDPAVKVAALKVAKNAVTAAQVAVALQVSTLQATLDALAKEIALVTEKQQAKAKTP